VCILFYFYTVKENRGIYIHPSRTGGQAERMDGFLNRDEEGCGKKKSEGR
jgi:hypothetical protein